MWTRSRHFMFPFPHNHPETGPDQEEELRTLCGPNIKSLCSNFEILLWLAVSSHLHLWAGEQLESPYLGRKNTRTQWSDLLLPSSFDNGADGKSSHKALSEFFKSCYLQDYNNSRLDVAHESYTCMKNVIYMEDEPWSFGVHNYTHGSSWDRS